MPNFGVTLLHPLAKEVAIERLRQFASAMQEQHHDRVQNVEQQWEGDQLRFSFSTLGLAISGHIVVEDQQARVEGKLPFAALIFRGRIEQEIRTQLEQLLR